jgi:hypothetical protein
MYYARMGPILAWQLERAEGHADKCAALMVRGGGGKVFEHLSLVPGLTMAGCVDLDSDVLVLSILSVRLNDSGGSAKEVNATNLMSRQSHAVDTEPKPSFTRTW